MQVWKERLLDKRMESGSSSIGHGFPKRCSWSIVGVVVSAPVFVQAAMWRQMTERSMSTLLPAAHRLLQKGQVARLDSR